jgi:hypothetical protein
LVAEKVVVAAGKAVAAAAVGKAVVPRVVAQGVGVKSNS